MPPQNDGLGVRFGKRRDHPQVLDGLVTKRPFIMLGAAAFVLLIPLALTSNAFSIRRLGKVWARIHRLIYITAVCGAIHFALATKVLSGEQYLYPTLIMLLLAYRLVRSYLKRARGTAGRPAAGPPPNVGMVGRAATS